MKIEKERIIEKIRKLLGEGKYTSVTINSDDVKVKGKILKYINIEEEILSYKYGEDDRLTAFTLDELEDIYSIFSSTFILMNLNNKSMKEV